MPEQSPSPELTSAISLLAPGRALDLACGSGRHSRWLAERGWQVTSVDLDSAFPAAIHADLENHEFVIEPAAWELIVCWLYWQPDLIAELAAGIRPGGVIAIAGKTTGRFATSLADFRKAFPGWVELASGQNEVRAFLIGRRPGEELVDQ